MFECAFAPATKRPARRVRIEAAVAQSGEPVIVTVVPPVVQHVGEGVARLADRADDARMIAIAEDVAAAPCLAASR